MCINLSVCLSVWLRVLYAMCLCVSVCTHMLDGVRRYASTHTSYRHTHTQTCIHNIPTSTRKYTQTNTHITQTSPHACVNHLTSILTLQPLPTDNENDGLPSFVASPGLDSNILAWAVSGVCMFEYAHMCVYACMYLRMCMYVCMLSACVYVCCVCVCHDVCPPLCM